MKAAGQIVSHVAKWLTRRSAAPPVAWPRHGIFESLLEIPFLLLSRVLFGSSSVWADRVTALQPILLTSLICGLIFVWVRRITSSYVWGFTLALIAAISTMLWPYAYIALETSQSLFLMLAGFLALSSDRRKGWSRALLFAFSCSLAISLKSNSGVLVPAVAFLVFCYFRREGSRSFELAKIELRKALVVIGIIVMVYLLSAYTRSLSPVWTGGTFSVLRGFTTHDPLVILSNMISLLASVNKGLIIYSPVVLLCLLSLQQAYKKRPRVAIFAALTLFGLLAGVAPFIFWSEETWGPRYLHSSIGPLLICFALTRSAIRFRLRKEMPLIVLALAGTVVSFLGMFYYYGNLHGAMTMSSQPTIEAIQHDPNWNHIRFNAKLMRIWLRDGANAPADGSELWPPPQHRWYPVRDQTFAFDPAPKVDLRLYASPQPWVLHFFNSPKTLSEKLYWTSFIVCFVAGSGLLVWLGFLAARLDKTATREARSNESQ